MDPWWSLAETWAIAPHAAPPGNPWQRIVAHMLAADQRVAPPEELVALGARLRSEGAPEDVCQTLELLVRLRTGTPVEVAEAGAAVALAATPETAARAWHLTGLARLYTDRVDAAGDALLAGLECVEPSPRRVWLLGSLSTVLIAEGAWTEARGILDAVAAERTRMDDAVGTAITAGQRATLELGLCNPEVALDHLAAAMASVGHRIPTVSRLRLETLGLTASAELGAVDEALFTAVRQGMVDPATGYLGGLAALALLKARPRSPEAPGWLQLARERCQDPSGSAQVEAWAEHLADAPVPPPAPPQGRASEGRFLASLLRSDRALAAGDRSLAQGWLDHAHTLAILTNTPLWFAEVDRRYARIDPIRSALRASQRFTGQPEADLLRTQQEEVTIVFNDLVGFTDRSQFLAPEAVMDTVRSLFEVSSPVLSRHRVRPLQYMGDGLLAVCQGPDHAARGRAFAIDLVARCGRIGRVRRARGEPLALTTRAGVASGTVVLGLVGSLAKFEHLAIGRTTNLAARLQGQARPGEVVWQVAAGQPAPEQVRLKGFAEPVAIDRVCADPTA